MLPRSVQIKPIEGCLKLGKRPVVFKIAFIIFSCIYLSGTRCLPKAYGEIPRFSEKPRVVRTYSKNATNWDYKTEPYLDFVNQEIVDDMLEKGLQELTGKSTAKKAWQDIFSSYKHGDKVAIKPNFNAIQHGYRDIITSPQIINAVIKGLLDSLSIAEKNIFIYDLCKIIPDEIMRNRIKYSVNYVQAFNRVSILERVEYRIRRCLNLGLELPDTSAPIHMRERVLDKQGNPITCYIPKVLTQAQHLINVPIMTNHIFLLASGPLKNHFGTVRFSNYQSAPTILHGKILENSIVDLNLNPHIKDKTRLIVCDALFGVYCRGEGKVKRKWKTFPSENGIPNSLFLARDPVALGSVTSDYILREREFHGYKIFSSQYLHDAMLKGLGIYDQVDKSGDYQKIEYIQRELTFNPDS